MKWFIVVSLMGFTPEGESTGLQKITSTTLYDSEMLCEALANNLGKSMRGHARHYGLDMVIVTECRETQ